MGWLLGSTPSWYVAVLLISFLVLIQVKLNLECDERKEKHMRTKEFWFWKVLVTSFMEMADDILGGACPPT